MEFPPQAPCSRHSCSGSTENAPTPAHPSAQVSLLILRCSIGFHASLLAFPPIQLSPVNRRVPDILSLNNVDNVFRDVRGVVADTLQILRHQNQFKRGKN